MWFQKPFPNRFFRNRSLRDHVHLVCQCVWYFSPESWPILNYCTLYNIPYYASVCCNIIRTAHHVCLVANVSIYCFLVGTGDHDNRKTGTLYLIIEQFICALSLQIKFERVLDYYFFFNPGEKNKFSSELYQGKRIVSCAARISERI